NCGNPYFKRRELEVDELIDFPNSTSAQILNEIDRFWDKGDRFAEYGFLHRRGYLFYGKQGGGKSSLIHQIVSKIIRAGHVAFFCEQPYNFLTCMNNFRQVEPDRPMVCVFEDVDAIIEHYGDSELLQWLDGNNQVDKAVNIASTNYPEKLDRRIISRPRRFDRILRIESPSAELREAYFARKAPDQPAVERAEWVRETEGLSFAALAELIISVFCLDKSFPEAVTLMRNLDAHNPSSDEFADEGVPADEFAL
ncbi:MAG: AAA family ATPase, partial [Planctomycetales bacterium]